MALPRIPYAAQTAPVMSWLDQTFAALGAIGVVPCDTSGSNAITLTPKTDTPTISTYANHKLFSFVAAANSTANITIQVSALAALPLYNPNNITEQLAANALVSGRLYVVAYNSNLNGGAGGFVLVSSTPSRLVQRVAATPNSAFSTTLISNYNLDTVLTVTDGIQLCSVSFVPVSTNNFLTIRAAATCAGSNLGVAVSLMGAVFLQNTNMQQCFVNAGQGAQELRNLYIEAAQVQFTQTSALTASFRVVPSLQTSGVAGVSVNGSVPLGRRGGGKLATTLVVEEWTAGS